MAPLVPPENGVTVRMYRQGHGDCFLLALPRPADGGEDPGPFYALVDCGSKPGSQDFLHKKGLGAIVDHVGAATGKRLDLVVITHEHQDHVNGLSAQFDEFEIGEAWLAWTEDPTDEVANELRRRHRDQLLGLLGARRQLALAVGDDDPTVGRIDTLLSLELGVDLAAANLDAALAAASDPTRSFNKVAMKRIKDGARKGRGVDFLRPGDRRQIAAAGGVAAYVLGPPRDPDLLDDEDPVGGEGFPDPAHGARGLSFAAAARAAGEAAARTPPFAAKYCVAADKAFDPADRDKEFFALRYGQGEEGQNDRDRIEVPTNAPWRRIDAEWLYAAESLALKLNRGVNNTSLVLALELPRSKKVLLFAGDAQRGNWVSWREPVWETAGGEVGARDLLARTVLYKVGHHGSHNATLAGREDDDYPNLAWMGHGAAGGEFTAMITAVTEWAMTNNRPPWRHPLPSIKQALVAKAQGRVFQTDADRPERPASTSAAEWQRFEDRCRFDPLYFDYVVYDE